MATDTVSLTPPEQPECDTSDRDVTTTNDVVKELPRVRGQRNACALRVHTGNLAIRKLKKMGAAEKGRRK